VKIFHEDSSISILSYACTNIFLEELLCMGIERAIHVIPKMATQIGLSKENISILEIGLPKENGGSTVQERPKWIARIMKRRLETGIVRHKALGCS
jgi:hypothetical protein